VFLLIGCEIIMTLAGLLIAGCVAVVGDQPAEELPPAAFRKVEYESDIRPIFAASCLGCHGAKKQKGGLALHRKATALAGGDDGPVILPGKSAESRLIRYVGRLDDDHPMPPEGVGKPLTPEQVGLLRAWIDQGTDWPDDSKSASETSDHWSFRRPIRPEPPEVDEPLWARNSIDRFVATRLAREGLKPSPEANRTTLVRRLSLDLIGLPPTIAEVDAFLSDDRSDAYERVADRLLASPQYGERWARRWLDGARYADTNGYEKDRERSIWPYRDWVIKALNDDMPFDRFTIEQIAGDLLPGASASQKVATGFHRNTMINEEGGIDVEEFRFASLVDRVATTGAVWLGLTVQCAQCHTHKFDPITQREYYQFLAFFDNVDEPEIDLPDAMIAARRLEIERKAEELEATLADRFPDRDSDRTWEVATPSRATAESGASLTIAADGSILVSGSTSPSDRYEVEVEAELSGVSSIRIEALTDPSLPHRGPGRAPNGNFVLLEFAVKDERGQPIKLIAAESDVSQHGFDVGGAIDNNSSTGWAVDVGGGWLNKDHLASFRIEGKPLLEGRGRLTFRLDHGYGGKHTLGRFRIALGREPAAPLGDRRSRLEAKQKEWESALRLTHWSPIAPSSVVSGKHATMTVLEDHSVLASGDKPNNDVYKVEVPVDGSPLTAIRLEVLPHDSLPDRGPGRAPLFSVGNFLLTEVEASLVSPDGSTVRPIKFRDASADFEESGRPASQTIDGKIDTGWSIGGAVGRPHEIVFRLTEPLQTEAGGRLRLTLNQFTIHQTTIGRFRVSTSSDADPPTASRLPAKVEAIALIPRDQRTPEQAKALERHFLSVAPELDRANAEIAALRRSMPAFKSTMVLQERPAGQSRTTHIRKRGEFLRAGGAVTPGVPSVLHALPDGAEPDRLKLARWLVDEGNPLVGRVIMNRAWQAFFGRGLVATVEDFGTRGERPTHPELLDWLATEFPRQGWSMKAMHRLIVTSATYRQASQASPALLARDPRNELLARGPRFRVESEMVRDIALAASGLLDPTIGGPSVYPPQPDGVTALSYGQVTWPTSKGRDRYRRGLYTFTKRTAPFAAFATFDMPTSEVACVRRERSNTPLQALTLLNDPAFVEAARALGRRVVLEGPSDAEGRARFAFRLCVGRPPTADEVTSIIAFLDQQTARLRSKELDAVKIGGADSKGDPIELASWTTVARALLNLDETITKE
jgi:mono/diheme cytochrome c family protein